MKSKQQFFLRDLLMPRLKRLIHGSIFPEEYDFMGDSISEAKDRRRGINPMSEEYTNKVNERRRQLGVSPLGKDGQAKDGTSSDYADAIAQEKLVKAENFLTTYLSEALYERDPANTCCKENKCFDEYDRLARTVINTESDGKPFTEALPEAMITSFGRDAFDHKTINTMSEAVAKEIAESIAGGGAIERILDEMEHMLHMEHQTINGARASSIYYDMMHQRLDKLGFEGERPARTYKPIFFRHRKNKSD